jgi:Ubiquitin family
MFVHTMLSINDDEASKLAEKLRTNPEFLQTLLSKLAVQAHDGTTGFHSQDDFEPLPINGLSNFAETDVNCVQTPRTGWHPQGSIHNMQSYGCNGDGIVLNGSTRVATMRPHVMLNGSTEDMLPAISYQNSRPDPSGIYHSPYTCTNHQYDAHRDTAWDIHPFIFGNPSTLHESTCTVPGSHHGHNSILSDISYEDHIVKLAPQQPTKKQISVHTATTYKYSYACESGFDHKKEDVTTLSASKTSCENEMDDLFNSSEWNLEALYGLPTIDEFQDYYTTEDLPTYAVVIGSTVRSHNRRAASCAYRIARGASNSSLSVVYERLLSYFRGEGLNTYDNKFPQEADQLLFVLIAERSDPSSAIMKFQALTDPLRRDEVVLADIRLNGNHAQVEVLKTLIDQKRRDLEAMNPVSSMSKKYIFTNHLNVIQALIDNEEHDDMSVLQFKVSIQSMWDQFFTLDKAPKKRGRPKKECSAVINGGKPKRDCSVVINGNLCNLGIAVQNAFDITIKTLTGKQIVLCVQLTDTVAVVKTKIFLKEHIPTDQQRLIMNGKQWDDDHTLERCNVTSESIVYLILRLRGGGYVNHNNGDTYNDGSVNCDAEDYDNNLSIIATRGIHKSKLRGQQLEREGKSPYLLPSNSSFTPSINGRSGWSYRSCYALKQEVSARMCH